MTNKKLAIKNAYKQYINESFDLELLGLKESSTPKERATAFIQTVKECQWGESIFNIMDHLQGLGQGIDIEFTYYDILKRAEKYGLINSMLSARKYENMEKSKALERVEDRICNDYFNKIATYILQMAK